MTLQARLTRRPITLTVAVLVVLTLAHLAGTRVVRVPSGLIGRYWAGTSWSGPVRVTAIDPDITTRRVERTWPWAAEPFSARWEGFVLVPRAGRYRFATSSDDGSWVWVDGRLVVDNGGEHAPRLASGQLELTQGSHALRVDFFQAASSFSIDVLWAEGGGPLTPLTAQELAQALVSERRIAVHAVLARLGNLLVVGWITVYVCLLAKWFARLLHAIGRQEVGDEIPRALAAVLVLAAIVGAAGLWWGLPGSGWAPDELTPADVLTAMGRHFSNGWWSKYPPLHYYVLAIAALPPSAVRLTGCCGIDLWTIDTLLFVIYRLVSLCFAVGTVFLTYVCGRLLFDARSALVASLFFSLTSPFVFYAKLANLDVPYLFWFTLSLVAYLRILTRGSGSDYILFASAAALAVCTKDQAYGLYVLPAIAVAVLTYQRAQGRTALARLRAAFGDRKVVSAIAVGIGLFVVGQNLVWNYSGFVAHVRDITGPSSEYRIFEPTFAGQLAMLRATVWLTRLSFGWPLFVLCVCGVVVAAAGRRIFPPRRLWWVALPALSYYVTFVMIVGYNYDRFLLPIFLTLALFGGLAAGVATRAAGRYGRYAMLVVALGLAYTAAYAGTVDLAMMQDSRYGVERWLREHVPEDAMLGTIGFEIYLPRLEGFRTTPLERRMAALRQIDPDFVVVNTDFAARFREGSGAWAEYQRLQTGQTGYVPVVDSAGFGLFGGLRLDRRFAGTPANSFSNLPKINPRIVVFAKDRRRAT